MTVFEKNQRPGGRCDHFTREGHRFDTGPTLLIMPLVYEAEFAALGANFHEMLDLQRVDPTYCLVFDDGSQLALTHELEQMRRQLEAMERGSFEQFQRYMAEGHQHYDLAMDKLVGRDFRRATDFFNLENIPLLFQLQPFTGHYHHMGHYFKNERLKARAIASN